ncbi:MAG: 30S ribosomal protein S6 [Phycisphaeraceae bacterium]|nr:30S ribosomal protein S6 [Phycisphaeraceae bacterium]
MSEQVMHQYEGMFLISQSEAVDLGGVVSHIEEILGRAHARIVAMKKWDERRLAYEINKQKRGVYLLVYFVAPAASLAHIERDCNLSERLLRVLVTKADHLTEEEMLSADAREELKVEARLRAERAAERDAREGAGATLGRPEEEEFEGGEQAEGEGGDTVTATAEDEDEE